MNFTTPLFLIFFVFAAAGWYHLPQRLRRYWLLISSIIFYAVSSVQYLAIIIIDVLISYGAARAFDNKLLGKERLWTGIGIVFIITELFVFKYFDFFMRSLVSPYYNNNLLLPVGLSFYTFAICGYLIDVQQRRISAESDLIDYTNFVVFFPVLLSGPISKAKNLIPQIKQPKDFSYARMKRGILRFAWGAWKKLVMADSLGSVVDAVYADLFAASGGELLIAAILYSIQIYLDFSAYSDMAIGCAEILGINIKENFQAPYLSKNVKEFWKKWHISLTDWFREYLYYPLGGNRKGTVRTWLNVLIVFAVSGLWHGASWTFVIWGILNGVLQIMSDISEQIQRKFRKEQNIQLKSRLVTACRYVLTFAILSATWIVFRSETITDSVFVYKRILLILRDGFGKIKCIEPRTLIVLLPGLAACILEDFHISKGERTRDLEQTSFKYWLVITVLLLTILLFGIYGEGYDFREFVYFQF